MLSKSLMKMDAGFIQIQSVVIMRLSVMDSLSKTDVNNLILAFLIMTLVVVLLRSMIRMAVLWICLLRNVEAIRFNVQLVYSLSFFIFIFIFNNIRCTGIDSHGCELGKMCVDKFDSAGCAAVCQPDCAPFEMTCPVDFDEVGCAGDKVCKEIIDSYGCDLVSKSLLVN